MSGLPISKGHLITTYVILLLLLFIISLMSYYYRDIPVKQLIMVINEENNGRIVLKDLVSLNTIITIIESLLLTFRMRLIFS